MTRHFWRGTLLVSSSLGQAFEVASFRPNASGDSPSGPSISGADDGARLTLQNLGSDGSPRAGGRCAAVSGGRAGVAWQRRPTDCALARDTAPKTPQTFVPPPNQGTAGLLPVH